MSRSVHVDWEMTEEEWGQLRSVLLHSNLPYPRRLAAEGKLGPVVPPAQPVSGYYVTSRVEIPDGAAYRISYCSEPQGTMCIHRDGSRHYFGTDGRTVREQVDWLDAVQRYDRE